MQDELISRQAVTDTTICEGISCNECSFNTCEDGQPGCLLKERVDKLPPVTPQPKTWRREYSDIYDHYLCGNCKTVVMDYDNYCHNCGAKLIEPQESEGKYADNN